MKSDRNHLFASEAAAYLFFGAATTAVNWIVYTILNFAAPLSITGCNLAAWAFAILFAYVTNRLFVFHSDARNFRQIAREFFLFLGARVFTGLFEIFLPSVLFRLGFDQSFLGIRGFFAKAAVTVLIILMNYILSKAVVFRRKSGSGN